MQQEKDTCTGTLPTQLPATHTPVLFLCFKNVATRIILM